MIASKVKGAIKPNKKVSNKHWMMKISSICSST